MKNFCVKFSQFRSIREIFLTVDDYNMDEHLKISYRLSLLPGIKRAWDRWLYIDLTFILGSVGSVDLCTEAYSLIVAV